MANLLYVAIANQKRHMALYLMCEYMDDARKARFQQKLEAAGKKVDMGKSCVRLRSLNDLPLDIVGEAVASVSPKEFIAYYKNIRGEHA